MVLNENPSNYFADVEQIAFSPSHLVPGIEPSPDKMLQVCRALCCLTPLFTFKPVKNYLLIHFVYINLEPNAFSMHCAYDRTKPSLRFFVVGLPISLTIL